MHYIFKNTKFEYLTEDGKFTKDVDKARVFLTPGRARVAASTDGGEDFGYVMPVKIVLLEGGTNSYGV